MSSTATFSDHISEVALSANLKCGWILRTFSTRDRLLMTTLWKSLVQPVLEYSCQLWSPSKPGEIKKLEEIQHCFLKKIAGFSKFNYWQQLILLKHYSLQRRRERYIAMYIWKVLEDLVPNFGIEEICNKRTGRYCKVPQVKASAPARIKTLRFTSLSINGPRVFNSLPRNVRDISQCTIDTFKRALDGYLQSIPDEPRITRMIPYCLKNSNSIIVMKPI